MRPPLSPGVGRGGNMSPTLVKGWSCTGMGCGVQATQGPARIVKSPGYSAQIRDGRCRPAW